MPAPTTEAAPKPARRVGLRILRVLALLAAVLLVIWFVAGIFYDDELPRAQANEGLTAVEDVMHMEAEFRQDRDRLPEPAELDRGLLHAEPHVTNVEFLPAGALRISYRGRHEIDGKTLTLTPYMDKDDLRWRCDLPDIKPRWWPDYCRPKSTP